MVADMSKEAPRLFVSIRDAARESGASYEVVRRALVRLGAGHKDENGRVWVSIDLVQTFKSERQRSGYLHPRGAKLRDLYVLHRFAAHLESADAVATFADRGSDRVASATRTWEIEADLRKAAEARA